MTPISFKRHRFPPVIFQHAVWLYARFTLSFRDVQELLAERGIDISNETVRRWFLKFGRLIAGNLRSSRPRPSASWHLDEMVIRIRDREYWLWRAIEDEGEVLDFLVQRRRCSRSARRLLQKLLKKRGFAPKRITTGKLKSYWCASVKAWARWHGPARAMPLCCLDRDRDSLLEVILLVLGLSSHSTFAPLTSQDPAWGNCIGIDGRDLP